MVSVIAEFSLSLLSPFSCPLRRSEAGVSEPTRLTSGSPSGDIQKASDMTVAPGFQQAPLGITFDRFVRACVVIKTLTEAFSGVRPLSSNCGKLAQSDCAFFHLFPLDSLIQTAMDGFRCTLLFFFLTFSPLPFVAWGRPSGHDRHLSSVPPVALPGEVATVGRNVSMCTPTPRTINIPDCGFFHSNYDQFMQTVLSLP